MATMVTDIAIDSEMTAGEAFDAFDYTSRYYLQMSGKDFLKNVEAGHISPDDPRPGVSRVFAMLEMLDLSVGAGANAI